ncbi:MAG TPA: class 1 fructose-bisphosphatase [Anaerolineales bacterium]|nr:class 1 fructose-bisphosphatase [Anaerolineales bacterium]
MRPRVTIERFVLSKQPEHAKGKLTELFYDIALAAKLIAVQTKRAALLGNGGYEDTINIQGEQQRTLDVYADDIFIKTNDHTGRLAAMVSEEQDSIIQIPKKHKQGNYVLVYDPIDGSSNIDTNVTVGTIFGIYKIDDPNGDVPLETVLRPGKELVASGYIIYGTSTIFVYSTGQGVHGFTLDPEIGEFFLTHEDLRFPEEPTYYSMNFGAYRSWEPGVQAFADWLRKTDEIRLSQRYIGSFVGDFHRNLLYGGVYAYPAEKKYPNGKIRILYESAPMAFIAHNAGGYASDGNGPILEIKPDTLHQRSQVFIGNTSLVKKAESFYQQYNK